MTSKSTGKNLTEIFRILTTSLVLVKNLKKCFKNFNLKIFQIHAHTTVVLMIFFFKKCFKKINLKIFKNVYREKRSLLYLYVSLQCLYIFIFSSIQVNFEKSNVCQTKI